MEVRFFSDDQSHAEEFKKYMPVNVTMSYYTMEPALAQAELKFIRPVLGDELFEELAGTTGATGEVAEAIDLIKAAELRLAYWDSFDQLSVNMNDNGLADTQGENRVYRYQADALRENLHRQGYECIDKLMGLLEDNIDKFEKYKQSQYYSGNQHSSIRTAKEFFEATSIRYDYRTFAALRGYITNTERMELPFRIGKTLCDALLERTDNEGRWEDFVPLVQIFVGYWSMADAVMTLQGMWSSEGITEIHSSESTGAYAGKGTTLASMTVKENMQKQYRDVAENYMGKILRYLRENKDKFPEWENVEEPTSYRALLRDNTHKKSFKA